MRSFYLYGVVFAVLVLFAVFFSSTQLADPFGSNTNAPRINLASPKISNETRSIAGKFLNPKLRPFIHPLPPLTANSILVKELGSPYVFVDHNADSRWPIASVTKLMTAVIARERLDPASIITFSKNAAGQEGMAGSFVINEQFAVWDLIRAMLVVSSNKAATALAERLGSEVFLTAMRHKAAQLDMMQTTFEDVAGLSPVNQSTAADIEKLIRYIEREHPELLETSRQAEIEITELTSTIKRRLVSINQYAGSSDFIGGKTGFTDEAIGNLVSLFRLNGREFYIGVFGTPDRFGETAKLFDWLRLATS